jgi:hypothetical protein
MEMMWNRVWSGWWVFQDKNFISIILVRLIGCNSQFSAAPIVIQAGMCEACITDVYFPSLNRTHVFPFILINSINLLLKMNEVFFFFSRKCNHCMPFIMYRLCLLVMGRFCGVWTSHKLWECLIDWLQFTSLSCMSLLLWKQNSDTIFQRTFVVTENIFL